MRWARGADILLAASFSKPGGRLSILVDLVLLMDFRSRSTSSFDTWRTLNLFSDLLCTDLGGLQTKLHSGMAFSRKVVMIVVKKVQKLLPILIASFAFSPCKSKECIDGPVLALVGYMDLIVVQNVSGFALFSFNRFL